MIDKSVLAAIALDLSDGGFADQADFELLAERPGKSGRAQTALPVIGVATKLLANNLQEMY